MPTMISTRVTSKGQTTVPKEIRDELGIEADSRVYWTLGDGEARLTTELPIPCRVDSEEEFWDRINVALQQVAAGQVHEAGEIERELRTRYGIA